MKKTNNKGFNLVELIIVIAIMVILVAVIAPQYLKYVNNSKISVDVQTGAEIATAYNIAVANQENPFSNSMEIEGTAVGSITSRLGGTFFVYGTDTDGVKCVSLTVGENTYEVYPNPDNSSAVNSNAVPSGKTAKNGINNTTTNGGLKK